MFKTILTLRQAAAAAAAEELADANALLLLDQQIRDAQASFGRAQRALAVALAEQAQEGLRGGAMDKRVAALEARAQAALAGRREDLAWDAAEAIAALELELERDAGQQAQALFAGEIAQLRRSVSDAERRLGELRRGRRVARMTDAVIASRRGRMAAVPGHGALPEAEATLARLRQRQTEAAAVDGFLDGITAETRPQTVEDRLAEAGFGPAVRPTAASVLARLKASVVQGERA